MASPKLPQVQPDRSRSLWAQWRRSSVLGVATVMIVAVTALAVTYGTGVMLGSRIAPRRLAPATPPPPGGEEATPGSLGDRARAPDSTVPDRAIGPGTAPSTADDRPTRETPGSGSTQPDPPADAPRGTYPGMWPVASWGEVAQAVARGDIGSRDPAAVGLAFARTIGGLRRASARGVIIDEGRARVILAVGSARTGVDLVRVDARGLPSERAPWSVVRASGSITIASPAVDSSVSGPSITVEGSAPQGTVSVGVNDRRGWRALGVVAAPGRTYASSVRLRSARSGPAIAIALLGDPRSPSGLAATRITLAGPTTGTRPVSPETVAAAWFASLRAGDVHAAWDLLGPPARGRLGDWRGLASSLVGLEDGLGPTPGQSVSVTEVGTAGGTVYIAIARRDRGEATPLVSSVVLGDGPGGVSVASFASPSVTWRAPDATGDGLTALTSGSPVALVVDGGVVPARPTAGGTGLVADVGALRPGWHVATVLVLGADGPSAASQGFEVATTLDEPATPETSTTTTAPTTN